MKSFLLTVVIASGLVVGWVLLAPKSVDFNPTPSDPAASIDKTGTVVAPVGPPPSITSVDRTSLLRTSHIDELHRAYGAVGAAMKAILEATASMELGHVDRAKVTAQIHALMGAVTPEDLDYLIEVFDRVQDPTFRWWFQWIVKAIPNERFIGAVTEIWKLDPLGAADRFCDIGTAKSIDRLSSLLETTDDLDVRQRAIASVGHSRFEGRDGWLANVADDPRRRAEERATAMTTLGQSSSDTLTIERLMRTTLGSPIPVESLGKLSSEHPINDLRSAAMLGVILTGDMPALRSLIDKADAPGADPHLAEMLDRHLIGWNGPDVAELIQARVERRARLTLGDLRQVSRDLAATPRGRLEALRVHARSLDVAAELERLIAAMPR